MSRAIVVTGTRRETRRGVISAELDKHSPSHVIVGCYPGGVDLEAKQWALSRGLCPIVVHAPWKALGRTAGPKRNNCLAQVGKAMEAWKCIAVPDDESKGTHDCAKACARHGIPVEYAGATTVSRFPLRPATPGKVAP